MQQSQAISILIPVFNEQKHIGRLLNSLAGLRTGNEVLVIDGGSSDHTVALVHAFIASASREGPRFRLLHNPARRQAEALNIGLQAAVNPTCLRLDGHLQIVPDCDLQQEIDALLTLNEGSQRFCAAGFRQRFMSCALIDSAIALLAATPFLSGFSRYRYATKPCHTWNTAWLFCVNKELALQIGGFDSSTTANEDQNFNRRLIAHTGKPILIFPQLPLYYQPRSTLAGLTCQYFNYGQARGLQARGEPLMVAGTAMHLLITLIYAGVILSAPANYGVTLLFILGCNLFAMASDRLHYFRNASLPKPNPLILITALLVSPLVAVLPSFARSSGTLWQFSRRGPSGTPPPLAHPQQDATSSPQSADPATAQHCAGNRGHS